MTVLIRDAVPDDAGAIARMHLQSWVEAYSDLLPAAYWRTDSVERRTQRWRANLTAPQPGVATRIALRDGTLLGSATVGPARPNPTAGDPVRDRELYALYVLAAEHGSGLAQRLVDAVLEPDEPAEAWVFEANPRARAFYARHRFGPEFGHQPEIRLIR